MAASSCSSDGSAGLTGIGTLTVSIKSDNRLRLPSGELSEIECGVNPEISGISLTMSDMNGGYTHTWESFDQFPQDESYFAGTYILDVSGAGPVKEGFDNPSFSGSSEVVIKENERTDAVVEIAPSSAFISITFDPSLTTAYPSAKAIAHALGRTYFTYLPDESRMLCLNPSSAEILLSLDIDGKDIIFRVMEFEDTKPATLYALTLGADISGECPVITATSGDDRLSFVLTPEFLSSTPPEITLSIPTDEITLPEGDIPNEPIVATVSMTDGDIEHLFLSSHSVSLEEYMIPTEADLLNLTPEESSVFNRLGLTVSSLPGCTKVDFTSMLGNLVYLRADNALSTFSLIAVNSNGLTSAPITLKVTTTPVEIEVVETTDAVMCVDRTKVLVRCSAPGFENHVDVEIERSSGRWERTPFTITRSEESLYELEFSIPEGSSPANARVLYCEEVRSTFSIDRVLPDFDVDIDGYAKTASIRIRTEDQELTKKITERINVYIDGTAVPVYRRYPESGVVTVIDLKPLTTYTIKTTLMDGVSDPIFTPEEKFTTEGTPQITNSNFEERKDGPYAKNMPSGGVYAQTSVDIFNWQHHTDYSCEVPKNWANTNDKTFNLSAKNINTWYLQPSVQLVRDDATNGSFSVLLTSVAYDPDGDEIPPYAQTGQPYLDYSPIIPDIKYRAAGKLFLGSYTYDKSSGAETYKEGISWDSRPYSLSGAYKYVPCTVDRDDGGLVIVEVLGIIDGKEDLIASGRLILPYAASFTAFNVPLSYNTFGVKATRLKVMFASSQHIGTIGEETEGVATVPDPLTATSTGGKLWIDNVTLTY